MGDWIKRVALKVAQRSHFVTDVAVHIASSPHVQRHVKDSYPYLRERFIANGREHRVDSAARSDLVARFERIDASVPMGSSPTDGLFLAEMLLNVEAEGALVECGCFAGGSTSKLSLVASLLGRRLFVFDSFEGLPVVEQQYLRDQHCRRSDEWVTDWTSGRYAGRIDEVQGNIRKFGDFGVCSFTKGWFSETLTHDNLPHEVAFAFADVDLANSARDCFTALWPVLTNGGIYVTHDTAYIKVLQEIYNPELWLNQFKATPPMLFGAGFGLCNDSPHLGYMVKGDALSPEYLKRLTIDK